MDSSSGRFKSSWDRQKTHVKALFKKSFSVRKRQKRSNCCQILFPLAMLTLLFGLQCLLDSFLDTEDNKIKEIAHPSLLSRFSTVYYDPLDDDFCHYSDFKKTDNGEILVSFDGDPTVLGSYGGVYKAGGILNEMSRIPFEGEPTFNPDRDDIHSFDFNNLGVTNMRFSRNDSSVASNLMMRSFETIVLSKTGTLTFCRKVLTDSDLSFKTVGSLENLTQTVYDKYIHEPSYANAIHFNTISLKDKSFDFMLGVNISRSGGLDFGLMMNLVSSSVYRLVNGDSVDEIVFEGLRNVPQKEGKVSFDIVTMMGKMIYIFIFSLCAPVITTQLVYDKQFCLRDIMKQMGLRMKVYWLQQYVFSFLQYFISISIMWIVAALLFDFAFWTKNDFSVLFITMLLWGNVIVSFSFFMSTFHKGARSAMVVGYILVFGFGFLSMELADGVYDSDSTPPFIVFLVSLVPHFNFFRGLSILSDNVAHSQPGLRFADVADSDVQLSYVWVMMIVQAKILLMLTFYLENAFVSKRGALFFMRKHKTVDMMTVPLLETVEDGRTQHLSGDVMAEKRRVLSAQNEDAITIVNLRKTYASESGAPPKHAVNGLSLGAQKGGCLGFLGPNGAGKTTTINILCGLFLPTKGEVLLNGLDITDPGHQDRIHENMGVCPQHDRLWSELTAREHLLFYGALKGLKGTALKEEIESLLEEVNLMEARDKKAGEYSGGMKRRLSVACAFIGHPGVVLLDEPSTGLDPYSRRKLWDVILRRKESCTILLTTHSMEECEALCDRIAIMTAGQLKAIGSSADLKSRFGQGFKISVSCADNPKTVESVHNFIIKLCPHATLLNSLAGVSNYEVSLEEMNLGTVFQQLLHNRESGQGVIDFGISNTTLEEVFFRVCFGDGALEDQNAF